MKTIQVVEYRYLRNAETGEKISFYSTLPYGKRSDWNVVNDGFTWGITDYRGNYTQGLGRTPAKTFRDALIFAKEFAEKTGARLVANDY